VAKFGYAKTALRFKIRKKTMKMLIGGEWIDRAEKIEVRNPYSGELIDAVPNGGAEDMAAAIAGAVQGAKISRDLPVHRRIEILRRAAALVEQSKEKLARLIASEGVKTIREARKEVSRCVITLTISAEEARRVVGETLPFDSAPGSENRVGYYYRFPVGVIAAITPFNDPLNLVAHKLGPAIAAGNAVVLKPSDYTPLSALTLGEIFMEAGLPPKILSIVTGRAENFGEALIADPRIRMISFTGGVKSALEILKKTGLKKVSMELGSNSPVIVMDDAEMDKAVALSVSGAFWAAGQNCVGVQRLYIHEKVYEEFAKKFAGQTQKLKCGPQLDETTDVGPLITEKEARRVESWVNQAVAAGAKVLAGGQREGTVYWPTVLSDVAEGATIDCEEIFGPVVALYRIKSLDEAIAKSNSKNYGLHAAIFTQDLNRAFTAIKELEVGGVIVNDSTDYRIDMMPFGGVKNSGLGREGIKFAIMDMTETKVVCFNL
jgi:glyceraldehyde-3-phosphate dehydrogenase (NADP+)